VARNGRIDSRGALRLRGGAVAGRPCGRGERDRRRISVPDASDLCDRSGVGARWGRTFGLIAYRAGRIEMRRRAPACSALTFAFCGYIAEPHKRVYGARAWGTRTPISP